MTQTKIRKFAKDTKTVFGQDATMQQMKKTVLLKKATMLTDIFPPRTHTSHASGGQRTRPGRTSGRRNKKGAASHTRKPRPKTVLPGLSSRQEGHLLCLRHISFSFAASSFLRDWGDSGAGLKLPAFIWRLTAETEMPSSSVKRMTWVMSPSPAPTG